MQNNKILAATALNIAFLHDVISLSEEERFQSEAIENFYDEEINEDISDIKIKEVYQEGKIISIKVEIEEETYVLPDDKQILLDMIFEDEKGD